jgi:hypothetical protein
VTAIEEEEPIMLKKTLLMLGLLGATFAMSPARPAHAAYLELSGQLTMLRVHDVGTGYGPPQDFMDVEVVIALKSQPGKAFGFKLRDGTDRVTHDAMVDLLRDAFANGYNVVINAELPTGKTNGVLNRVWVTR